jgi:hypothetical protein
VIKRDEPIYVLTHVKARMGGEEQPAAASERRRLIFWTFRSKLVIQSAAKGKKNKSITLGTKMMHFERNVRQHN